MQSQTDLAQVMKACTAIFLLAVAAGCYVEGKYDYDYDGTCNCHAALPTLSLDEIQQFAQVVLL